VGLVYVTGVSGAGKSSCLAELRQRGLTALGTDEDQLCAFHDLSTGQVVERTPGDSRPDWEANAWSMIASRVEDLARSARDELVFLCGAAHNDREFWSLFDKVLLLWVDEGTLRRRVAARAASLRDHDFGRSPDQLRAILSWRAPKQERDLALGAVRIDATRPLADVVDEVVACASAPTA
jgi:dephospho-CoA kinase